MKKSTLPPGIEEVMHQLMGCRNFEPNPAFRKKPPSKPVKATKKRCQK